MGAKARGSSPLARYQVNVLDDQKGAPGAPVVYEDKPTFQNLIGRIEHVAQMGTLITDFTHIKAGALHRANGGYLILDARRVLLEPFAWEGLKRALRARAIRIESLGEAFAGMPQQHVPAPMRTSRTGLQQHRPAQRVEPVQVEQVDGGGKGPGQHRRRAPLPSPPLLRKGGSRFRSA